MNQFTSQFESSSKIGTEGFLRLKNSVGVVTLDADLEKDAGAKLFTESRRVFYVRKG